LRWHFKVLDLSPALSGLLHAKLEGGTFKIATSIESWLPKFWSLSGTYWIFRVAFVDITSKESRVRGDAAVFLLHSRSISMVT
jgi:hypothetical protein